MKISVAALALAVVARAQVVSRGGLVLARLCWSIRYGSLMAVGEGVEWSVRRKEGWRRSNDDNDCRVSHQDKKGGVKGVQGETNVD